MSGPGDPPMRMLVGFDGSEGGSDALELARLLGAVPGSSAVIATILYTGPLPIDLAGLEGEEAAPAEPIFAQARTRLAGLLEEARAFGGGSPGAILTALAEREDFDVVVVGSPHRGALGRVLIGSVGASLLNGAPCDVAIAPHGYAEGRHGPFRTIAVGYDGTPESKAALTRAAELARHMNAAVRILTAAAPPLVVAGGGGYSPASIPPDPERIMEEALRSLDPELSADSRRLDGPAAGELLRACEEGVDLLVLGSRGYGPVARVLLGSVSRQVAQKAPCPVWVAARPQG